MISSKRWLQFIDWAILIDIDDRRLYWFVENGLRTCVAATRALAAKKKQSSKKAQPGKGRAEKSDAIHSWWAFIWDISLLLP